MELSAGQSVLHILDAERIGGQAELYPCCWKKALSERYAFHAEF